MSTRGPHRAEQSRRCRCVLRKPRTCCARFGRAKSTRSSSTGPAATRSTRCTAPTNRTARWSNRCRKGPSVLSGRGDILYANARFAALVGEPLGIRRRAAGLIDSCRRPTDTAWTPCSAEAAVDAEAVWSGSGSRTVEVSLSLATTTVSGRRSTESDRDGLERHSLEAHSTRDLAQRENRTKDEFLATHSRTNYARRSARSAPPHNCSR